MSMIASAAIRLFPLLLVTSLLAFALGGHLPVAHADGVSVHEVTVTPKKILATGGQTTVQVTVSGSVEADTRITLTTELGAFGAPTGPNRISLAVQPTGDDGGLAGATLFGDGRAGATAVTARIGQSVRTTIVTFVGPPAEIHFTSLADGAVLPANALPRADVQVTDANGFTVLEAQVILSASGALLRRLRDGTDPGTATLTLRADTNGSVFVYLAGDPGTVTLLATSGAASATVTLTLHGPPASLQLLALRSAVNLGDIPFPAPPGTLIAILFDDGGRPVPGSVIGFTADRPGVAVVHSGAGESTLTDSAGRAAGHVTVAASASPGPATITAQIGDLQASAPVRVVGPLDQVTLNVTPISTADAPSNTGYRVTATLVDALGQAAPTGYHVRFSADDPVPADRLLIPEDPVLARDGAAETTITLLEPVESVRVRATVEEAEGLSASALLPITIVLAEGITLSPGLNVFTWTGAPISAAEAVASVAGSVAAVWVARDGQRWQGYFPNAGLGVNFELRPGDQVFVFARPAVVFPLP